MTAAHMAAGTLDLLGGLSCPSSDAHPLPPQAPISSQLTIFYSGTVNVYNDVPADKAHAIMLLLANGKEGHSQGADASVMPSNANGGAPTNSATALVSRAPVATSTIFKQPFSKPSTLPPMSPYQAPQPERKPQLIGKRTQAELPFARKASLARFLEKRKDRVQAKMEVSSEEEFPGSASKKCKVADDGTSHLE